MGVLISHRWSVYQAPPQEDCKLPAAFQKDRPGFSGPYLRNRQIFMALVFRQLVHLPPVSSWYQYQRVLISNLQTLNSIYYSNHIVLFFLFFFLLYCSNFELPLYFGTCTFSVLGLFFSDACKNSWYNFIQHFQKFEVGRTIIYFISICHIHDSITMKPTTVALILAVQVAKPSMHSP